MDARRDELKVVVLSRMYSLSASEHLLWSWGLSPARTRILVLILYAWGISEADRLFMGCA